MLFVPNPDEGSVQLAPLLRITLPLNVIVRLLVLVELQIIVPEIFVIPLMVILRRTVSCAPVSIVNAETVKVEPGAVIAPVLAIITPPLAVKDVIHSSVVAR